MSPFLPALSYQTCSCSVLLPLNPFEVPLSHRVDPESPSTLTLSRVLVTHYGPSSFLCPMFWMYELKFIDYCNPLGYSQSEAPYSYRVLVLLKLCAVKYLHNRPTSVFVPTIVEFQASFPHQWSWVFLSGGALIVTGGQLPGPVGLHWCPLPIPPSLRN